MSESKGLSLDGGKISNPKASDPEKSGTPQTIYTIVDTNGQVIGETMRPPVLTRALRFISCMFCALLILNLGGFVMNWSMDPDSCFSSACLHSFGGGNIQLGGDFLKHDASCTDQLKRYFGVPSSDGAPPSPYLTEVRNVSISALNLFRGLALAGQPSRDQVIVFDIDETVLSNRATFFPPPPGARSGFHSRMRARLARNDEDVSEEQFVSKGSNGVMTKGDVNFFNGGVAPGAQAQGDMMMTPSPRSHPMKHSCMANAPFAPPLPPMLDLYHALYAMNYSVAFLTGRSERDRNYTLANLEAAGYGRQCLTAIQGETRSGGEGDLSPAVVAAARAAPRAAPPCFVTLFLRKNEDTRFASVYKPEKRFQLLEAGFDVVGNFGDQFSDLVGPSAAPNSFKLPNPAYYIL